MKVYLVKPNIGKEEEENVLSVLRSGMLAQGPWVKRFEGEFSKYLGVAHTIAVSNGTAALDLALRAIGIGPGDEVIVPDFTFIATANAILFQGAKPVFADIDMKTYNISVEDAEMKVTKKTKAIIAVHLFGHPADISGLQKLCAKHNLHLIEDCAQAHGAEWDGKKVGSFGIGAFSFYPTKNMTTSEGGAVATQDAELAKKVDLLRNHGQADKYLHTVLGYNLRMTDICGAIGVAQLAKLDWMNAARIRNAEILNKGLSGVRGLVTPYKAENAKHVYHQYVVRVTPEFKISRDELKDKLIEKGVGCAVHYPKPITSQPFYSSQGYKAGGANSNKVAEQVLSLPVHPGLKKEELDYVIQCVKELGE